MRLYNRIINDNRFIFEFARYFVVGGSAFVLDAGVMIFFREIIFQGLHTLIASFIGYLVGLIYNFLLSCGFVFKGGFEKIKDKEIQSFLIFSIIGIIGLGLTVFLMWLFVDILKIYYILSKIITGAIVVFWNYFARKFIVFHEK